MQHGHFALYGMIFVLLLSTGPLYAEQPAVEAAQPSKISVDPLEQWREFLARIGWTAFYIPSGRFGLGTVISPNGQNVRLDPKSCFQKLKVPPAQRAAVPEIEEGSDFGTDAGVALLFGERVSGAIEGAAKARIAVSQATHVAVDSKVLSEAWNPACDPYIRVIRNPAVISELLSGRLSVTFERNDGGKVSITGQKLKPLLMGQARGHLEVEGSATLVTKEAVFFAYKAVTPIWQNGRPLFTALSLNHLTPDYFAVLESKNISAAFAIGPISPGGPYDYTLSAENPS